VTESDTLLRLFYAPTSPYVRKVMVVSHWLGLESRIERLESAANPVARDERIAAFNPLAKVPAASTPEGQLLYDSRVICEYLDACGQGGLFPVGKRRWPALTRQALGDGLLDAALLARYERVARAPHEHSENWYQGQLTKVHAALDAIERQIGELERNPVDIGTIAFGCALGYLDFRFPELGWRAAHPAAAAWFAEFDHQPAMVATRPHN